MSDTSVVHDVNPIREALAVMGQRGWHQGDYVGPDGSVCMLGAIREAMGSLSSCAKTVRFMGLETLMCKVAREQFPERMTRSNIIAKFNDHKDTTVDDVVLVMEKAALKFDERGGV